MVSCSLAKLFDHQCLSNHITDVEDIMWEQGIRREISKPLAA